MIIHKGEDERLPHEGIEYYHKSKEPETIQECAMLFCWMCVHTLPLISPPDCEVRKQLYVRNNHG